MKHRKNTSLLVMLCLSIMALGLLLTTQSAYAQPSHDPGLEILAAKEDLHVLIFAHDFPPTIALQVSLHLPGAYAVDAADTVSVNTNEHGYFFKVIHIPTALVGEAQIEIIVEGNNHNYTAESTFSNTTFEDDQIAQLAREIIQRAEAAQDSGGVVNNEANKDESINPTPKIPPPTTEEIASNWLQSGGEDVEWEDPVPFVWPAEKRWLSGYNFTSAHPGIDIAASADDLIFAAASGKVVEVNFSNRGYGNMVLIEHLSGYQTLYAHLNSILVETGSYVFQGQPIGLAGSTGNSTGVHLHFEIHYQNEFINPWLFFDN